MKSDTVLQTLKETNKEFSHAEELIFTSLVEDSKKMEERMTALEKKVDGVEKKIDSVLSDQKFVKEQLSSTQSSIDNLTSLVKANIDQQKEKVKVFSSIFSNQWFWIFAIIAIILIAGGSATDLLGIIKIGN